MTSRQRKIDILNRVLHGSVNSVLQYVENSTPYVAADFRENYEAVRWYKVGWAWTRK